MENFIELYTDGAASGNPGPGGFGVVLKFMHHRKEISAGFKLTTNNRMELLAVIIGLESVTNNNLPVKVYSDSKYVVDSINLKWVFGWRKTGFKNKANVDLWQRFLKIYDAQKHQFFLGKKGMQVMLKTTDAMNWRLWHQKSQTYLEMKVMML